MSVQASGLGLLLVLGIGCGSDPPPPPRGTASAHVYDFAGQPVAGATVMFQDRLFTDGTFATTDATGAATAEVDAGWYVTRVDGGALSTFTNVGPGDDLAFGIAAPPAQPDPLPTLTVQFPADPEVPDDFVTLYLSCGLLANGTAAMGAVTQVAVPCAGPIDVFVVGGTRTAFARGVAVADGVATIATLTYGPRAPAASLAIANAPIESGVDAYPYGIGDPLGFASFTAVAAQTVALEVAPAPIRTVLDVFLKSGDARVWGVEPAAIDLGALALPEIISAAIDDDTPAITWQTGTTGGGTPDIAIATITNANRGRTWQIEGPWHATAMQLPILPLQLGAGSLDSSDRVTQVQLLRAASLGGPDGWRAVPFGGAAVLPSESLAPETDGSDAESFYQF